MKRLFIFYLMIFGAISDLAASSVLAPACPTISVTGTNASCYGASDGTATVQIITGGSGSYTYTWSNGSITTGSSSNIYFLEAGTYTVSVKDNVSGCSVVGAYVVSEPDPITISGTVTNVNCFGDATGGINISVTGGRTPYSYTWTNGSGSVVASTQNISNVAAGTYTVSVNASTGGCSLSKTYTITQPTGELNSSAVINNVDCFSNSTGNIDVSVWGGTAPYGYLWDTGQNSQDISGLTSGSYTLTITDNKGCTRIQTYSVSQPPVLSGVMSSSNVLCNGEATGSVSIIASGGTSPYSYSWQNSQNVLTASTSGLTNVAADTYQVTVEDANGCRYTSSRTITEPALIELSALVNNVSCHGGADGAIDLSLTGGVGPFTYSWTNSIPNNIANSQDLNNIPAETYTVQVTDNNGCNKSLSRTVTQPLTPISVDVSTTDVLCHGENTGAIDLTVMGGTSPYSVVWTSGQVTEDINGLFAGNYAYTVTDAKGCIYNANVVINQPAQPLMVTNVITDVNCFGELNGAIDLSVSGGTPGYSFQWSSSSFQLSNTNEDLINYAADDYRYEVTDANGCKSIDTLTIAEPPLLENSITGVNILCKGESTGSIDLTVTGGTTPYVYLWNNGAVTEDLINLPAGFYSVLVTDDHGCDTDNSIELTEPLDSLNYSYEVVDVKCNDGTDGEILLELNGGTLPYFINWSNGNTSILNENLTSGYYEFLVTDNNGCTVTDSIFVDQPDPVSLNENITNVSCNGLSDGIIDISPTGGTSPYNFTWFNSKFALSAQTEDIVNFPADIYQLEILDSNNCFYEMYLEIEQPDSIVISYTYNVVSCSEGSDASIYVEVTGGTPAYNFDWSNGATSQNLTDIGAGVYELDLTDNNGCQDSIKVEIIQPEPIEVFFETTDVTCVDQFDGTAYATSTGGNGGYSYSWSNGEQNAYTEGLTNDWHQVEVTDILGCDKTDSVYIDVNPIACIDPVNTFSPNDDQYNDTWIIDNTELYPNINMQIYNKWGNLVFKSENGYEPWDGKVNGKDLPPGLYYWILELRNDDNDVLKGNITIIK